MYRTRRLLAKGYWCMERSCFRATTSSRMASFPPHDSVTRPFDYQPLTLFGPGPSNCWPSVLEVMSKQPYGIFVPGMVDDVMAAIQEGLKYLFQTRNEMTYCISGTGMSGMEATFVNMVEPGDKVLCLENGQWGGRAADIVSRINGIPIVLKNGPGEPFTPEQIEKSLQENRPALLFIAHGESSTALAQPVENLGQLCHKYNCLLIVDTVASLGGIPFFMDKWEVDVAYSGSQKCLSCPPGLAPISFSPRACEKIANRKTKIPSFYFDFNLTAKHWGLTGPRVYHHTPAINTLFGLREALTVIAKEGLEQSWKRHRDNAELLWKGIEELGLEMFIKNPEHRLPTINAVKVPDDLPDPYRVNTYFNSVNIELGTGLPPLKGKVWRIGLMGYNSTPENVNLALTTLEAGLKNIGYPVKMKSEL